MCSGNSFLEVIQIELISIFVQNNARGKTFDQLSWKVN